MNTVSVTLFAQRPMSSTERAHLYARELASKRANASPTSSLASSVDESLAFDPTLRGDLVDLRKHLDGFEERLHEPRVGEIMDTSRARTGYLYRVRDELRDDA